MTTNTLHGVTLITPILLKYLDLTPEKVPELIGCYLADDKIVIMTKQRHFHWLRDYPNFCCAHDNCLHSHFCFSFPKAHEKELHNMQTGNPYEIKLSPEQIPLLNFQPTQTLRSAI